MSEPPTVILRAPTDSDADVLFRLAADLDTWEERRSPSSPAPLTRAAWDASHSGWIPIRPGPSDS